MPEKISWWCISCYFFQFFLFFTFFYIFEHSGRSNRSDEKQKRKRVFVFAFCTSSVQSGRKMSSKTKTRFCFWFSSLPPIGRTKTKYEKTCLACYFISSCQDYKHVVKLQQAQSSAVCWFHEIINVPSNVRHRRGLVLPYWECCLWHFQWSASSQGPPTLKGLSGWRVVHNQGASCIDSVSILVVTGECIEMNVMPSWLWRTLITNWGTI